jgi:ribonucleoside-diphosphate reductase alpha chain
MLRVIRNHRRAAYGVARDRAEAAAHELGAYEGLETPPVPIDADWMEGRRTSPFGGIANGPELLRAARRSWDDALVRGEQHGYRNAQTTVIAPTGTIGLLMDCDTTGVEPDFALVKFKKLAGGGYFKIANQSLRPALESLGYEPKQVQDILYYVLGRQELEVPLPDDTGQIKHSTRSLAEWLKDKGFDDAAIERIRQGVAGAMELSFVFNAWTIGDETMDRLDLRGRKNILRALGLSRAQIDKLNELVCGVGTVEGAPHLRPEHLPVFDCANKCGKKGQRFIAPLGHIRMMAAVQPFISGAISKTINMPNQATVKDITDAYRMSWELGLKANALYRDGSKLSQPLNASADDDVEDEEGLEAGKDEAAEEAVTVANRIASVATDISAIAERPPVEKIVERIVERPMRRRLTSTRRSLTHKFNVAGHEGYLTVGLYDDGRPGELFITMAKEGSTIGGLMDSLGTAISVALQYGVPIESLVNKFSHQRFEPAGMTDNRDIPFAKSLVDYIFRWMGMEFISGYRAANAPRRSEPATPAPLPASPADEVSPIITASIPPRFAADSAPANRVQRLEDETKPDDEGAARGDANHGGRLAIDDPQIAVQAASRHNPLEIVTRQTTAVIAVAEKDNAAAAVMVSVLNEQNSRLMGDAPACGVCGSITVRNGTCYKCLNCGTSAGCS